MPFNSLVFIFFFLPLVLLLHQLCGHRLRNILLLCASLLFYAWGGIIGLPMLLWIIFGNYCFGLLLSYFSPGRKRKVCLVFGIIANLCPLLYYKYSGFLLVNINSLFPGRQISFHVPSESHIPLGISFIAFHALSYLLDIFSDRSAGLKNPLQLGLYLSFFPKVLSGPIQKYGDAVRQLTVRRVTLADFSTGVERFIIGLAKKMLLANVLADIVDTIFQMPAASLSVGMAWLGAVCYSLQIYFDFAGYTDMAIGIGLMFGFNLPENFKYPYLARSVQEFWQRWHITLSQWFREYLYIPLGGNRHGNFRTYCNLCIVFFLCGLWHGASWNFIVWGLLHGLFLVLERWRLAQFLARLPKMLGHCYLLFFIVISWVFFRADNLHSALHYLGAMLGWGTAPVVNPWLILKLDRQVALVGFLSCLLAFPTVPAMARALRAFADRQVGGGGLIMNIFYGAKAGGLAILFLLALMEMASGTYNPFIYFRF